MAREILEGPPVQLVEILAERIATGTLDEHPVGTSLLPQNRH
jgi:dihydroneopterin aldolase